MSGERLKHPADGSGPAPAGQEAPGQERVAKALARAGVASRREVERLIAEGRVQLNGRVLAGPAVTVGPDDVLTVDGRVVEEKEPTRLFRYHKPVDLLTTHNDPKGRPTVFEALPPGLPRLISIGRLDINSEGLLLLTNDGSLSRALELPSSGWARRYRARARGRVTQERLDTLADGITVEGVSYGPIEARLDKAKDGPPGAPESANLWISVALTEGKNREVRRVLEHLGLKVNRLIRLAYGPFSLGTLGSGEIEEVGPRVIRELLEGLVPPESMPEGDRPLWTPPKRTVAAARRGAAVEAAPEPKPKKVYKAGWAKAKPPKAGGGPPRRSSAPKPRAGGAEPASGRTASAEPASPRTAPAGYGSRPSRPTPAKDRPAWGAAPARSAPPKFRAGEAPPAKAGRPPVRSAKPAPPGGKPRPGGKPGRPPRS